MARAPRQRQVKIDNSGADQLPPIDPEADVDAEKLIKKILNTIDHEVTRISAKSSAMILDLQESKLLESYLRAVVVADDRLKLHKKKLDEDQVKKLNMNEIRDYLNEFSQENKK